MKKIPKCMGELRLCPIFILTFFSLSGFAHPNKGHSLNGPPIPEQQQEYTLTGTVRDSYGPLPGVHVLIKGTQTGTFSDKDGAFALTVSGNNTLVLSYVGYSTLEVSILGRNTLEVELLAEATQLQEVEVNAGYYTVKERERTGSISRVTAAEIELQPVNNPMGAMQGYMPGVNIVQNTGVPGGGYSIQIRGRNFIDGGTDPLFIVDGVPYGSQSLASAELSAGITGANTSPLNAINPSEIESIEVLKDADATAIYGSRGANGVVLITTKKGKVGATRMNVNLSSSLGRVSHFQELLKTPEYLEIRREGIINDGFGDRLENPIYDFLYPELKSWEQNRYTDWQKELIGGTAFRNTAQLSLSGGSDRTQFLISGAFQNETTVFPGDSNYKKGSVHSNIGHRSESGRLNIQMIANYTKEHNLMPRTDLTVVAYRLPPNAPDLYNSLGELNWENNTWDNPLASLEEEYSAQINTLFANMAISYQLFPRMEIKTNFGYNTYQMESYRLSPNTSRNPKFGFTPEDYSSIITNSSKRNSWIVEPQLQWRQKMNDFDFDVLLGTTFQSQTSTQSVQEASGFPINALLKNIAAANTVEVLSVSDTEYRYQAIFGRINLKFRDRYIFNLTGRRDGSSRFGPGRQFGNFGAAGLAWIFSEEVFIRSGNILSHGKLRGSYGSTGSDNIGDYRFLNTYNITGNDYNGTMVLEPTGIFNPIFGWEENKKLEIAFELGFLKDHLLLNTAWYQNRSSNQLIGLPLAATTGFNSLSGNFDATVENTGVEVELNTINIRRKEFQWSTFFNITLPKNKLVEFPGLETSAFASKYKIGKPLTIIHLYRSLGVDPETGIYQFEDYNGDGNITGLEDRQWIEDLSPRFYGGIGNKFTYKNLSLDIFFQFKGQKAYNYIRNVSAPGMLNNAPAYFMDRWEQPGDNKSLMIATSGSNYNLIPSWVNHTLSNKAISDASYMRLRNISLAFKVPEKLGGNTDIHIYLQGQNLWTLTRYDGPDPEQFSQLILPPLRQITLGAKIGF